MINCSSVEFLSQHILTLWDESYNKPMTVLVGGCSRTGKTVLSSKLSENFISLGINTAIVKLDSWLISVDNRKQDSSVLERYELPSIISSITKIQRGETIYPPIYDPVSRRRVAEYGLDLISIKDGILFVEGIVALAIEELVSNATIRIFVDIPDMLRQQRLVHFYSDIKKLNRKEFECIIETREKEEVNFIKKTAVNADIIFDGLELKLGNREAL